MQHSSSLAKVAKVCQKLLREITGPSSNYVMGTDKIGPGAEYLFHAPILAYAVVDACESILSAQIEETLVLVLNFGPGELSNETVVHDGEFLFLCVRGSCSPRNALS